MTPVNKKMPEKGLLEIDFPLAGEIVTSPYYAFRINTFQINVPSNVEVAVSIDEGDWRPCRFSIGFWWHDWSGYESGNHQVRAQAFDVDGTIIAVDSRRIEVRLNGFDESPRRRGRHGP